jgi:catechol 2,3-dioxygenase-like lactoylglutathione lyase family enzyme
LGEDTGRTAKEESVITGAHFLLYTADPEADRAFFRDVLGFRGVDAGGGWLIFALPPAELAVHPTDGNFVQRHAEADLLGAVLYLMCDDLQATVTALRTRQVSCAEIGRAEWGLYTSVRLPSGGRIGLYQPTHPSPLIPGSRAVD